MRARFWINGVNRKVAGTDDEGNRRFYGEVTLNAVSRTTDDSVAWAHYTPTGTLTMTVNPDALPPLGAPGSVAHRPGSPAWC